MKNTFIKTTDMVISAVFAAVICVCSVITVNIGPVPINLAVLGILLAVGICGMCRGFVSVSLFIALGAFGLPVFAGFKAGIAVLAGPTGGYITGYLFMALIAGVGVKFFKNNNVMSVLFLALGLFSCYIFGTLWFVVSTGSELGYALSVCVVPFVPVDMIKIAVARVICVQMYKNKAINRYS